MASHPDLVALLRQLGPAGSQLITDDLVSTHVQEELDTARARRSKEAVKYLRLRLLHEMCVQKLAAPVPAAVTEAAALIADPTAAAAAAGSVSAKAKLAIRSPDQKRRDAEAAAAAAKKAAEEAAAARLARLEDVRLGRALLGVSRAASLVPSASAAAGGRTGASDVAGAGGPGPGSATTTTVDPMASAAAATRGPLGVDATLVKEQLHLALPSHRPVGAHQRVRAMLVEDLEQRIQREYSKAARFAAAIKRGVDYPEVVVESYAQQLAGPRLLNLTETVTTAHAELVRDVATSRSKIDLLRAHTVRELQRAVDTVMRMLHSGELDRYIEYNALRAAFLVTSTRTALHKLALLQARMEAAALRDELLPACRILRDRLRARLAAAADEMTEASETLAAYREANVRYAREHPEGAAPASAAAALDGSRGAQPHLGGRMEELAREYRSLQELIAEQREHVDKLRRANE